ncbi:MAG: hypothetical protein AAFX81_18715 [Pseudomonadota bacterium]
MGRRFVVTVAGPLEVRGPEGPIRLPGTKEAAIVATLALSPQRRRTRAWLRALLWGDRFEAQAAASLRQSLSRLRRALSDHPEFFCADGDSVWLPPEIVEIDVGRVGQRQELLEGIDVRSEAFEDWLRAERMAWEGRAERTPTDVDPVALLPRPRIILCPVIAPDAVGPGGYTEALCDDVVHGLCAHDLVDVIDLRDRSASIADRLPEADLALGQIVARIRVGSGAGSMLVSVCATEPTSGRVVAAYTSELSIGRSGGPRPDAFAELSCRTADTLLRAALTVVPTGTSRTSVALAVIELMMHDRGRHAAVRNYLFRAFDAQPSAICAAWCAFTAAQSLGERLQDDHTLDLQACEALCRRAIQLDPANGLVRAIVGHLFGFVARRPDLADEQIRLALELCPRVPLVNDFAAMNALYAGATRRGYRLALAAARLGRFGPMRVYFEASVAICAAALGRHDEAIHVSRLVLVEMPDFLPVMRHLVGSLAANGDIDAARTVALRTRSFDPDFSSERILASDYPLPSPDSVALVRSGLARVGLDVP